MSSSVDISSEDSNVQTTPLENATSKDDNSETTETDQTISLDSPLSENEISSEVVVVTKTKTKTKNPAGNPFSNCAKLEAIKSSLLRPSVFAAALTGRGSRLSSSLTSATAGLLASVLSSNGKHHFYGLTRCEGKCPNILLSTHSFCNFLLNRRWNVMLLVIIIFI